MDLRRQPSSLSDTLSEQCLDKHAASRHRLRFIFYSGGHGPKTPIDIKISLTLCGILTHTALQRRIYISLPLLVMGGGRMTTTKKKSDARINVRLSSDLKHTIEEAAAALGQTVSEFTVSTVLREARNVLQNAQVTRLSNRDRDTFLAALQESNAPNDALKAAARSYKKRIS
ncbi:MAG TPA: hypothetical protein DD473_03600 [Planctomycetaceae bacterium]|nr:hypothetical protein [Planctomycetaceae bacterium]